MCRRKQMRKEKEPERMRNQATQMKAKGEEKKSRKQLGNNCTLISRMAQNRISDAKTCMSRCSIFRVLSMYSSVSAFLFSILLFFYRALAFPGADSFFFPLFPFHHFSTNLFISPALFWFRILFKSLRLPKK